MSPFSALSPLSPLSLYTPLDKPRTSPQATRRAEDEKRAKKEQQDAAARDPENAPSGVLLCVANVLLMCC